MATILVSGALANKPRNGGEAWVRLNWVLGFRQLGFRVFFVEQIAREACVDGIGVAADFSRSINRDYFQKIIAEFGLTDSASLIFNNGEEFAGLDEATLRDIAAEADLLVNISGHLTFEPVFRRVRRRAYLDIDPGYTQFWHAAGNHGARLDGHDVFFTIGENIGSSGCPIPTCGIDWKKTRPPVALDHWPAVARPFEKFTTVASWRGAFGPVEFEGVAYGVKVHEFRKFIELPQFVPAKFEIALDIHPAETRDLSSLRDHGWQIVDPKKTAADPNAFRDYIQKSSAEFSAAQGVYVQTRSGWFSDRTAAYLASGKPVLVQDTGTRLPAGEGFIPFCTVEEAVAGAQRIAGDYRRHCLAARALAEAYFDSAKVLTAFLEAAL